MFDFFEEPEIAEFDSLSVFELQSVQDKAETPPTPIQDLSLTQGISSPDDSIYVIPQKTKKIEKKTKKDDFDYKKYINEELRRLNAENLEGKAKKRLIQKIRNRMSAQRSRQRNKSILENLKHENELLKNQNNSLLDNLKSFKNENEYLKEQVTILRQYKKSYSSTDNDDEKSHISEEFNRENKRRGSTPLFKNFLFISLMVVAIVFNPERSLQNNVKMGGMIPLLSTKLPKSVKSLQKLDDICKDYCLKEYNCGDEGLKSDTTSLFAFNNQEKGLVLYTDVDKTNEVVPMMCFESNNEQQKHIILFKKGSLEFKIGEGDFLYVPDVISIKQDKSVVH